VTTATAQTEPIGFFALAADIARSEPLRVRNLTDWQRLIEHEPVVPHTTRHWIGWRCRRCSYTWSGNRNEHTAEDCAIVRALPPVEHSHSAGAWCHPQCPRWA
jgi:hypothetical protein